MILQSNVRNENTTYFSFGTKVTTRYCVDGVDLNCELKLVETSESKLIIVCCVFSF